MKLTIIILFSSIQLWFVYRFLTALPKYGSLRYAGLTYLLFQVIVAIVCFAAMWEIFAVGAGVAAHFELFPSLPGWFDFLVIPILLIGSLVVYLLAKDRETFKAELYFRIIAPILPIFGVPLVKNIAKLLPS